MKFPLKILKSAMNMTWTTDEISSSTISLKKKSIRSYIYRKILKYLSMWPATPQKIKNKVFY